MSRCTAQLYVEKNANVKTLSSASMVWEHWPATPK